MINNQDRKHVKLMQYFLDAYSKNTISLSDLLIKLDELARCTTPQAKWKEAFFDNWINLESLNTESSVKRDPCSNDELKLIDSSVCNIVHIIDDLLLSYEKIPDTSVKSIAKEIDSKWLLCPLCVDAWESDSRNAMVVCPN